MIQLIPIAALLATAALAQTPQVTWAGATYLKDNPSASAEQVRTSAALGAKGAAANVREGASTGFLRMRRTFPSSHETGHDVLFVYFYAKPPNLTPSSNNNSPFLKAIGMTADEWEAKSRSTSSIVKREIWSSVFQHGSIHKGDTIRLGQYDAKPGEVGAAHAYWRDWGSALRRTLVEKGIANAMQMFRLRLAPESAPYDFVALEAYAKGDGPLHPWPSLQEAFLSVHPGKDYHTFREAGAKAGSLRVGGVIYRVEEVIWK